MKEDLKKEVVVILNKIQEARKYSEPFHPAQLFTLCEDLVARRAWLISYLLETESKYRHKILEFKNKESFDEKGKLVKATNVEAENKAKTTEEYRDYKYLKYVDELISDQILLIKKFADKLDTEMRSSGSVVTR